jgi:hypothetical protein
MGQQQLLLLVLGIVIVGLAVVVGIQAFGENQKKANADALVNDGVRIASDAQAWKLKPAAFGGGSETEGWAGLTFEQLGYTATDNTYTNLNGDFTLAAGADVVITGCNAQSNNRVVVTVTDTTPESISTVVSSLGCAEAP